jgi:hypothetical protein
MASVRRLPALRGYLQVTDTDEVFGTRRVGASQTLYRFRTRLSGVDLWLGWAVGGKIPICVFSSAVSDHGPGHRGAPRR